MNDGLWIINPEGQEEYINFDELDDEILPRLIRPKGGFCYKANEFMHLPIVKSPFIINDWLPMQGKMLLYGGAKKGKSFLALQIANAVGCGKPFLGQHTSESVVLYLQFELAPATLRDRMTMSGLPYNNVWVGTTFHMKIDTNRGQDRLDQCIAAIEPDLVIIDPLYKVLSGDENNVADMMVVLEFLDTLIETYNCSFLIIHHGGKDLNKGARGTSVLEGYPDSYFKLAGKEKDGALHCELKGQMLRHAPEPEPIKIVMNKKTCMFEIDAQSGTSIERMRRFFIKNQDKVLTFDSLLANDGGSRRTAHDSLSKLVDSGEVERIKKGEYRWKLK